MVEAKRKIKFRPLSELRELEHTGQKDAASAGLELTPETHP
jgi:hypothetical protein